MNSNVVASDLPIVRRRLPQLPGVQAQKIRCIARSKRRGLAPCQLWAMHGQRVCSVHGGKSRQALRKAQERINDLLDPQRAIRTTADIAYADLTVLYDKEGYLLPVHQWPKDIRQAVASVKQMKRNSTAGDGLQEDVVEVKLWDKIGALSLLFKHFGLEAAQKVHLSGDWDIIAARLKRARQDIPASDDEI